MFLIVGYTTIEDPLVQVVDGCHVQVIIDSVIQPFVGAKDPQLFQQRPQKEWVGRLLAAGNPRDALVAQLFDVLPEIVADEPSAFVDRQQLDYNGEDGNVAVTFRPTGIKALCEEFAVEETAA